MTYFNDVNLGLPAEAYEVPGTENHDVLYPAVGQMYVPETQLYNVVHAVEYHGTTYFFENLIEFPVYRLCNVINYSPANVVDENSSYRSYWPTETVYSENEHDVENTPEYDNQLSDGEILSAESNEAMSESMDNFYSPGHDLITTNYENNSWNTTSVYSQYGINEPSIGIREDRVIHYSEVYENRSSEGIVSRTENNLQFEHMNYRWPNVRNGCCLNDGSSQEFILGSVRLQEIADTSAVKAAVKYKKESLYLIALSGKLYKKESLPVVDKMPDIQKVNEENSVIEYNNENTASQNEAVLQSNIFTEQFQKVCRRQSVQVITKMEVNQNVSDNVHRVELKYENVLKVKKIDSVVQGNIITTRSKKLHRRENIQVFDNVPNIEEFTGEEYAQESCNKNIQKIKQPVRQTNIFTERVKKMYRRETSQILQRIALIEEDFDEDCVEESCNNDKLKTERPAVKADIFTEKANKLYRRKSIQTFKKMPVIEEIADEECVVESCLKNAPKIERPVIEEIFDEKFENEPEDTDNTYDAFLEKNSQIANQLSPQENVMETIKVTVNDDNLSEAFIIQKTPMVNVERFSSDKVKEIKKKDNILNTGKIKSSIEENTYERMTLISLKEDADQNKSLESDIVLENGNETTEEPSQKSKKKRFQNLRKFFGRLLCCCSKGPT